MRTATQRCVPIRTAPNRKISDLEPDDLEPDYRTSRKVSLLTEINVSHKKVLSHTLCESENGGNPLSDSRSSHDTPTAL